MLRQRRITIRGRLIIAFVLVALLSAGLIAAMTLRDTAANLRASANQALGAAADQTASRVDTFLLNNLDAVRSEAQLPVFAPFFALPLRSRPNSPQRADALLTLQNLQRKDPVNLQRYALLDLQGITVLSTLDPPLEPALAQSYIAQPLRSGLPFAAPITLDPERRGPVLTLSSPVHDNGGATVGVLLVQYNAAILQQLLLASTGSVGAGSCALLVDDQQLILANACAPSVVGRTLVPADPATVGALQAARRLPPGTPQDLSANLPELQAGLAGIAQTRFFAARSDAAVLTQNAAAPLTAQPWSVVFARPQALFQAPLRAQIRATLLIALAVVIAAALLGALVGTRVVQPLEHLTAVAEQIGAGDWEVQVPSSRIHEVQVLGTTFNTMAAALRQTVSDLEGRVAARTADLETALSAQAAQGQQLAAALAEQQALNSLVSALSAPIIPVRAGVLVVPLAGQLDAGRVAAALHRLHLAIEQQRAEVAIVDLTGLLLVDPAIAQTLLRAAQTTALLGARFLVVGMRPDIAQAMVGLGADLADLHTWATLEAALAQLPALAPSSR